MTTLAEPGWAFDAYEAVRPRLPAARFAEGWRTADTLADIAGPYSLLLLDAYGVLNVGERAIPGVVDRIEDLRRAGKRVMVVTNSAGYPKRLMMERYARLGYDFAPQDVASSREALLRTLADRPPLHWGAMLSPAHGLEDLEDLDLAFLGDDPHDYESAEGFLLIGADGWTQARQSLLEASLAERPRPVLVGNPDIVAPREGGLSLEPGCFAHRLADRTGIRPAFYGKPFRDIYDLALSRLPSPVPPEEVLMVGDTLHTDVLGGRGMGFHTALVTDYGLLAGADVAEAIRRSSIVPDHVIARP